MRSDPCTKQFMLSLASEWHLKWANKTRGASIHTDTNEDI